MTSQIFANIYLNEFDRFVRHQLKPLAYLRYGDDFLVFLPDRKTATQTRQIAQVYLRDTLKLRLHPRNDVIIRPHQGVRILGVYLFPGGRALAPKAVHKIASRASLRNFTGYYGLIKQHGSRKQQRKLLRLPDDFMI